MNSIYGMVAEPAEGSRTAFHMEGTGAFVGAVHEVFLFGAEKTWLVEAQPIRDGELDLDAPALILGSFPHEWTAVAALTAHVTGR